MGKKKILVVEDDPALRKMYRSILESEFEVVEAGNGLEGVEKLENEEIDGILLDINMPVMDGYQMMMEMEGIEGAGEIPVLVLTNRGDDISRGEAVHLGASEYVRKDELDPEKLVEMVWGLVGE